MRRVAVVTNYRNSNYGSALQAYALQATVKELGYQCEHLKYGYNIKDSYFSRLVSAIRRPFGVIRRLSGSGRYQRRCKFRAFVGRHIAENPRLYSSIDELRATNDIYDVFICGSDQIWSPNQFNEWYYLSFVDKPFDRVLVVGDVNSTMATTIAAVKMGVPVAHVEAGLRSFDRTMPEEINRILTDAIADMLLVSDPAGMDNLRNEGHTEEEMVLVGNVMIDTLKRLLPQAQARDTLQRLGLTAGSYGLVTLHRPANVDTPESLGPLLDVLIETSKSLPLVFPIHPRTKQRIENFGFAEKIAAAAGLLQLGPAGYLDFLALSSQSKVTVTDSGGLQEESTVLGIPCLTARPNTERPITVTEGTSTLVGNNADMLRSGLTAVLDGTYKQGKCPELWDGHAAERIAKIVVERGEK